MSTLNPRSSSIKIENATDSANTCGRPNTTAPPVEMVQRDNKEMMASPLPAWTNRLTRAAGTPSALICNASPSSTQWRKTQLNYPIFLRSAREVQQLGNRTPSDIPLVTELVSKHKATSLYRNLVPSPVCNKRAARETARRGEDEQRQIKPTRYGPTYRQTRKCSKLLGRPLRQVTL